jgi:hypothetical protein
MSSSGADGAVATGSAEVSNEIGSAVSASRTATDVSIVDDTVTSEFVVSVVITLPIRVVAQ